MTSLNDIPKPRSTLRPILLTLLTAAAVGVLLERGLSANAQRADDVDGSWYLLLGREVAHGSRPYMDVWDIKPPGIFWINAAIVGAVGTNGQGVKLVGGLAAAASVVLLVVITRRLHSGRFACTVALLGAVYLFLYPFRVGSNRPETYIVVADLACAAIALRGLQPGARLGWLFAAGGVAGASFLFKQTGLAMALAVAGWLTWRLCDNAASRRDTLVRLGFFAAGWFIVVGIAAAILAIQGSAAAAFDAVFVFPMHHRHVNHSWAATSRWLQQAGRDVRPLIALAGVALVYHSIGRLRRTAAAESEFSDRVTFPADWLAAALVLAVISPLGRDWYLAPALAPLILLALEGLRCSGRLVHSAWRSESRLGIAVSGVGVVMLAHWGYEGVRAQLAAAHRAQRQRVHAEAESSTAQLAEAIVRHSRADDTLFVFGYRPDVYLRTNRRMGIRFAGTQEATTWADPRNDLLPRIFAELRAKPPGVLVGDPPDADPARAEEAERAADFAAWRERTYTLTEMDVWVRRSQENHP
jgi:4-amino-4-deoxy-L-arabinose transferase-like glycosyltransferase